MISESTQKVNYGFDHPCFGIFVENRVVVVVAAAALYFLDLYTGSYFSVVVVVCNSPVVTCL